MPTDSGAGNVRSITLNPADAARLNSLCGQFNDHLHLIEQRLQVQVYNRGHQFTVRGDDSAVAQAVDVLRHLYRETEGGREIDRDTVHLYLSEMAQADVHELPEDLLIKAGRVTVRPRGVNQSFYVRNVREHDLNFGIGPAGTGKTYLAVACAVEALQQEQVRRILLVRPAVEAGEKLGFLPGDLAQKVDPYLRPLYDALYEMLGFDQVARLIEKQVIEIAPLAYMRGRTLNHAFVILDESQNTTEEQMKMFLTRIGFGSTAIITGDLTQIDLPRGSRSGLRHAIEVLKQVKGIGVTRFEPKDVVRHPLVQRIVEAYEQHEASRHTDS